MPIATIDEKWRVTIPKEARKAMRLAPRTPLKVRLNKGSLVIQPLRRGVDSRERDTLTWLIAHPAKVEPRKLKGLNLDRMEDEMW
ncbi:MAG: AbrB/MazE/SpoVT family DNA-binding domain-containing protein [Candidatus Aenigmarchaeota archaeon]|nr:AbrB/MazE/SpoVT family DNA-binding domain-containing protein [Candidatus Aenigmarchaeota archaeon]